MYTRPWNPQTWLVSFCDLCMEWVALRPSASFTRSDLSVLILCQCSEPQVVTIVLFSRFLLLSPLHLGFHPEQQAVHECEHWNILKSSQKDGRVQCLNVGDHLQRRHALVRLLAASHLSDAAHPATSNFQLLWVCFALLLFDSFCFSLLILLSGRARIWGKHRSI